MDILPLVLSASLLLPPVSPAAPPPADPPAVIHLEERDADIRLIGHRGLSALAPENTLPAIRLAAAYGLAGCEFDVFPTADGVWVLNHDASIDGMTTGSGQISDLTYQQISSFQVDSGANVQSYPGLTLCTLSDALDLCADAEITPVIEIKAGRWEQLDDLVDLIRRKNMLEHTVIISYSYDILRYLRTGGDVIDLYWLVSAVDDQAIRLASALPNTGLDFWAADPANTPERIQKARDAGLKLIAWVADSRDQANALAQMRVDLITTNRLVPPPGRIQSPLKETIASPLQYP